MNDIHIVRNNLAFLKTFKYATYRYKRHVIGDDIINNIFLIKVIDVSFINYHAIRITDTVLLERMARNLRSIGSFF